MWATWPEVLKKFRETLQDRRADPAGAASIRWWPRKSLIKVTRRPNALPPSLLDQAWHQLNPSEIPKDALALKRRAAQGRASIFRRCRRVIARLYFSHAFAGGYSAGLLLLYLERSARCRHGGMDQGTRRIETGKRRSFARKRCCVARRFGRCT